MGNQSFYEAIKKAGGAEDTWILTVLDGSSQGEKQIWRGREVLWSTKEQKFFQKNEADLWKQLQTGREKGCMQAGGAALYVEKLGAEERLIICGAGYVGTALAKTAKLLDWEVIVIDDREEFRPYVEAAGADTFLCKPFDEALRSLDQRPTDYFVVVSRGHEWDRVCLTEILQKHYAYFGLMGSRARVRMLQREFVRKGFDEAKVQGMHTPVGLPIGAQTPEEIAISIMAEMIQIKRTEYKGTAFPKEVLEGIAYAVEAKEPFVMATIVTKRGSLPREVGTKMLFFENGKTFGTIGGGILEADIKKHALEMLETKESLYCYYADVSKQDAAKEGMVCGGTGTILVEYCSEQ